MPNGSYSWLTLSQAITQLGQRLNITPSNSSLWTTAELTIIIQQGLRIYNSLTWTFRKDFTFSSPNLWNSLGTLPGSPRLRTITDNYCYTELEYMLLEPPSGSVWTGTNQFNISDLSGALQSARDNIIQLSNCNQSLLSNIALTPNTIRTLLPDTVIDVERVRYIPVPLSSNGQIASVSGTTASSGINLGPWSNTGNIFSSSVFTSATIAQTQTSQYFVASGLGLSVPLNATISGVTVSLKSQVSSGGVPPVPQIVANLWNNASVGTSKNILLSSALTATTLGSQADLWGTTLTPAIVNSSSFGFTFYATLLGHLATDVINVNSLVITVYYTIITATYPATTLYRDDTVAQEFYEAPLYQQNPGTPQTFSLSSEPPLSWQVDIPPNLPGTYEAIVLQSGAPFNPPAATLVGLPDDFCYVAEFGALAELLGREAESTDSERAAYCTKKYQDGLELMLKSPWIGLGKVNGAAVSIDSIYALDQYDCNWDSNPSTFGPVIVAGGIDNVACPVGQGIGCTVIGNAPVPTLGTDFVQISRPMADTLLDICQSRAMFKIAGAEWKASLELEKRAMLACEAERVRLKSQGNFSDFFDERGRQQERDVNRFNNANKGK